MKEIKQIFLENKVFIIPYFIIAIAVLIIIYLYDKVDTHIVINQHHYPIFDVFFKYLTHLGDGILAIILSIFLLFIRYRWAIISIVSSLSIMIIIQFFKRLIFTNSFRPVKIFRYFYEGTYKLYIIPGTDPGINNSFPSGHSATAFAIFFLLALFVKNRSLKFAFFIIALLVAFSRVYLSWHFLEDTLAGSFLGIIITLITYLIINKSKKEYLDKSLIKKHHNS